MTKKTPEEEETILENIDNVSHNLSDQVSDLQKFIKELRSNRKIMSTFFPEDQGGAQHG